MATDWLHPLVALSECNGIWADYVERIYGHFESDFIRTAPRWPNKRLGIKRHPEHQGKCATFWHFVSEGKVEDDRIPDLRRCERIRWPRQLIDEFDEAPPGASGCRIVWWKTERRNENRYVLSLPDFSYVVIVADRGEYVLPWTAYCVQWEHQRAKLLKEFKNFWDQKG